MCITHALIPSLAEAQHSAILALGRSANVDLASQATAGCVTCFTGTHCNQAAAWANRTALKEKKGGEQAEACHDVDPVRSAVRLRLASESEPACHAAGGILILAQHIALMTMMMANVMVHGQSRTPNHWAGSKVNRKLHTKTPSHTRCARCLLPSLITAENVQLMSSVAYILYEVVCTRMQAYSQAEQGVLSWVM